MKNIFDVFDEIRGKKDSELTFDERARAEVVTDPIYLAQSQYKELHELNQQIKQISIYVKKVSFLLTVLFIGVLISWLR